MSQLPANLYTAAQARELDRLAIEQFGIPGIELMTRAGTAAYNLLRTRWPSADRIGVVCGIGNNAGDGFIVARLAHQAKFNVRVILVADASLLRGDALTAFNEILNLGIAINTFDESSLAECDVIVDAVFGIGLTREINGIWRAAIEAINRSQVPVLALDVPSGLNPDTGSPLGVAVKADITITFICIKQGLYTGMAPDLCGEIFFDGLNIPAETYASVHPSVKRLRLEDFADVLTRRKRVSHKGDSGRVLVIGGDLGMLGAVRMAAQAAAKVGAGLVTVATRPQHAALISIACPEIMAHGVETFDELHPLLEQADVVALGPGLGRRQWAEIMFEAAMQKNLPLVVDADALNLLAIKPHYRDSWILTPHPGEAGRLLGRTTAHVQANRFNAAAEMQQRYGGTVVLKGAGTLVCMANGISLCSAGNPGMASGGMGDILTGVIAGLLAQGVSLKDAAEFGVLIHSLAADEAATAGERGLAATDLLPYLRRLVNFK